MNKNWLVILLAVVFCFAAAPLMSADATAELGAKLFDDPALGGSANPAKCTDCHPGGKGLEKAGGSENLAAMINMCIAGPLKGGKLDGQSVEMESLKLYIKSLQK